MSSRSFALLNSMIYCSRWSVDLFECLKTGAKFIFADFVITIISAVSSWRPVEIGSGGTREGERAAEVRAGWWYSHLWSWFTLYLVYFRFLNEDEVNSDSSDDTRTFDNYLLSSWSFFGFNVKMLTEAQSSCKWLWPYLLSNHQWRAAQLCFEKTSIIEIHPTKIFRGLCF